VERDPHLVSKIGQAARAAFGKVFEEWHSEVDLPLKRTVIPGSQTPLGHALVPATPLPSFSSGIEDRGALCPACFDEQRRSGDRAGDPLAATLGSRTAPGVDRELPRRSVLGSCSPGKLIA
jgi:hypothetical protein